MVIYQGGLYFLDVFLKIIGVMLGSQPLGATAMKKHHHQAKKNQPKSIFSTARHAIVHVAVFSIISVAGHIATSSLSASMGEIGQGVAAPIGGMYLM